jgi:hypothetical protein
VEKYEQKSGREVEQQFLSKGGERGEERGREDISKGKRKEKRLDTCKRRAG